MARIYGFNLYYGRCKGRRGRRWLDLSALARRIRPSDELAAIRYFSAWVEGDRDKATRQNVYLRALRTIPNLTPTMGKFSIKPAWMTGASVPATYPPDVEVWKVQEKGSDVNLATYLLLDGVDLLYEEAIVISNDQDLATPSALGI